MQSECSLGRGPSLPETTSPGPGTSRLLVHFGDFLTVPLARTEGQCVSYRNSVAQPQSSHSKSCVGLRVRRYPWPVPSPGERGVMRFLLSRQRVRLVIGAALLLWIQGLLAPRPAWAGCNNLVHSNVPKLGASVNLDALIIGRVSMEIESNAGGDLPTLPKPSRPLPCSGPSCSGRVPLPVSASVVGAVDLVQWAVLSNSLDLVPSPGRTEWADESLADLTGAPSRVFHPPRASS